MRPGTYHTPGLGDKLNGQIDSAIKKIVKPKTRPKDDQVKSVK